MNFGFIPSEYEVIGNSESKSKIVLCKRELIPKQLPKDFVFLTKEKGSAADFIQLFVIFDDAFKDVDADVVVLGLGEFDISRKEKKLQVDAKSSRCDYFLEKKQTKEMALHGVNTLLELVRETFPLSKIISTDPLSRESSGYHNAAVDFVRKRVAKIDERHGHLSTWRRFQRDSRRKNRDKMANFPLKVDGFEAEGKPKEEEIENILAASLMAMGSMEEESAVVVNGVSYGRLF